MGVATASTKELFFELALEADPKSFVLYHQNLETYAEKKYDQAALPPHVTNPEYRPWILPQPLLEWTNQRLEPERPKSLILCGGTRLGKTEWARSLGPHTYWNGLFDLSVLNPNSEYAIFDDFDFNKFYSPKQWFGAQKVFTVTDKYRKKKTIQWGKPIIWLCNADQNPLAQDINMALREWLIENTFVVILENKLW